MWLLHRLVDEGNTVVVIEHQLDAVKTVDWVIDIGLKVAQVEVKCWLRAHQRTS